APLLRLRRACVPWPAPGEAGDADPLRGASAAPEIGRTRRDAGEQPDPVRQRPQAPADPLRAGVSDLSEKLAAYLAGQMPGTSEVAVSDLSRISGGASRETYRFRLDWRDAAGSAASRLLILRKD